MNKKLSQSFFSFGLCLAVFVFICASRTDKQITDQTEEVIKGSPELQELDSVCKQIPRAQDFQFVKKGGLDDQKISLSYYYISETRYEEVWRLLGNYFDKNGWKTVKNGEGVISSIKIIEFSNGKYRVAIQHGGMRSINYSFYCEKLK